ncbi:MAG: helix-turn-helix domain-containing protein [Anaerolineales bacterium]|nr:helix-turn-helix domain-containing protein [Anaerolineales bacterium]
MKQPDLGSLVAELRSQKGFTQEKLAEYCEVSTRTIQRIEQGEVDPRAYTLNSLSNSLEYDFNSEQKDETLWLVLLHLSSILCIVVIPLLIWSWKKGKNHKIDEHGKLVLNFQITLTVILFALALLLLLFSWVLIYLKDVFNTDIGMAYLGGLAVLLLPLILTGFYATFQGTVNAFRAVSGKPVRYPLSIPFLR